MSKLSAECPVSEVTIGAMEESADIPLTQYDVDVSVGELMRSTPDYWNEMVRTHFFDGIGPKVGAAIGEKKAAKLGGRVGKLGGAIGGFMAKATAAAGITVKVIPDPEVKREGTAFVSMVRLEIPGRDPLRLRSVSRAAARRPKTRITVTSQLIGPGAQSIATRLASEIETIQEVIQKEMGAGLEDFVAARGRQGTRSPRHKSSGLVA